MKQQASLVRINNGKFDGKTNHRGQTMFSIEASNIELSKLIISKLHLLGWKENDTFCGEDESEKYEGGCSHLFVVDSSDLDYFKPDFQKAKKEAISEMKSK